MLKQQNSAELSDREVATESGMGLANSKFLDSFKTVKASDFEINLSGFNENKPISSVPKEKIQKTLNFPSTNKLTESKELDMSMENTEETLEKKRASFNYMKKWDDYRNQLDSIYRGMIERIMNFMLELGNASLDSYISLSKFLREKVNQEKIFGSTANLNENELTVMKECEISRSLLELCAVDGTQKKDHLEFSLFIEQELLQNVLCPNHAKYQAFIENFSKIESKMRQNLNKMRLITREKFEDYAVVFSEIMRFYLTNSKVIMPKDLLALENFYLYAVVENHNLLKVYCKEMRDIWYCLKKMELERIKEFEQVLSSFIQQEEKLFQFYPNSQEQIQMIHERLKSVHPEKFIESLFDLNKILATEQIQYLRQKHKIENCTESNVFGFLEDFEIKALRSRQLMLGSFKAFEKDGNIQQKVPMSSSSLWKEIKLLISLDLNMLVLEDSSELSFRPVKIIRLPLCTCIYNDEVGLATLSEIKSKGLSMNNIEKHCFRFANTELLREFKEILNKYIRKDVKVMA